MRISYQVKLLISSLAICSGCLRHSLMTRSQFKLVRHERAELSKHKSEAQAEMRKVGALSAVVALGKDSKEPIIIPANAALLNADQLKLLGDADLCVRVYRADLGVAPAEASCALLTEQSKRWIKLDDDVASLQHRMSDQAAVLSATYAMASVQGEELKNLRQSFDLLKQGYTKTSDVINANNTQIGSIISQLNTSIADINSRLDSINQRLSSIK